jgi:hypothetical protein
VQDECPHLHVKREVRQELYHDTLFTVRVDRCEDCQAVLAYEVGP